LDLFTAIGEGAATASKLARSRSISGRGVRKLCDYLTMLGFLRKDGDAYSLSPDAAAFLDRRSPAYLGAPASEALAGQAVVAAFSTLTSSPGGNDPHWRWHTRPGTFRVDRIRAGDGRARDALSRPARRLSG
jgi:hypothetical protein